MKITSSSKQSSFFCCTKNNNSKTKRISSSNDAKGTNSLLKYCLFYPIQFVALSLGIYGIVLWSNIERSNNDNDVDSIATSHRASTVDDTHPKNNNENEQLYVDYFVNNGYAKAFDTMQYPMGLYDKNVDTTYICYQGPHEDPYIISYHHTKQSWDGPYKIGTSELGHDHGDPIQMHDGKIFAKAKSFYNKKTKTWINERKFQADNHGKPSIVIDQYGYIHISFGSHGGYESYRDTLGKNHYGDYSAGRQYHVKSTNPYSISTGFTVQNNGLSPYNGGAQRYRFYQQNKKKPELKHSRLSWNGCYAQFVHVPIIRDSQSSMMDDKNTSNMAIYHFVRHGAHASCWTYQVSINNGKTFGPPIPFVKTKQQVNNNVKDSWYCRFRSGSSDHSNGPTTKYSHWILAICVYHNHVMPPGLHTLESYNAYYMYLDTSSGIWYNVQGQELMAFPEPYLDHYNITVDSVYTKSGAFPNPKKPLAIMEMNHVGLTKEQLDDHAIVLKTENSTLFPYRYIHPGSIGIDEHGIPHVLLKIATDGVTTNVTSNIGRGSKCLFYMKWDVSNSQWTTPVSVTSKYYMSNNNIERSSIDEDGDMIVFNAKNISIVFPINNSTHAQIVSFQSIDYGQTFDVGMVLYSRTGIGKLKTSALIRHHHPHGQVLAYNIGTKGSPYRSLYLIGTNRAVKRLKVQANICQMKKIKHGTDDAAICVKPSRTIKSGK